MRYPANPAGHGTALNPANRFEPLHVEPIAEDETGEYSGNIRQPTIFLRDTTRTVLAKNDSPDIGFRFSLNPYRGCEHGCPYCYARPSHEYLGFSAGLDFERRILVKENAAEILRKTFLERKWRPETIALSGNTDCYQPVERNLGITRRCLAVCEEFRNPVSVITKSFLVTRDVDLLGRLASHAAANVFVSITTLDSDLARRLEPRAATPERRLEAVASLSAAGIPVGVMIAPVIPGLNDSEIPSILRRAAAAGARSAGWTLLRLPSPVDAIFVDWLENNFPEKRARVLGHIRQCRSGRLSDTRFGQRMRGEGNYAGQIAALFRAVARQTGLDRTLPPLSTAAFRRPPQPGQQLSFTSH